MDILLKKRISQISFFSHSQSFLTLQTYLQKLPLHYLALQLHICNYQYSLFIFTCFYAPIYILLFPPLISLFLVHLFMHILTYRILGLILLIPFSYTHTRSFISTATPFLELPLRTTPNFTTLTPQNSPLPPPDIIYIT